MVTDGKSTAEIKKAVVIAARGAEMADKSEAYIDAAFDLLEDQAKVDPIAKAIGDTSGKPVQSSDDIYAARNKALSDAWKFQPKEKV